MHHSDCYIEQERRYDMHMLAGRRNLTLFALIRGFEHGVTTYKKVCQQLKNTRHRIAVQPSHSVSGYIHKVTESQN